MSENKIVVLANENEEDHLLWIKALESYHIKLNYKIINLTSNYWLDELITYKPDYCLSRPPGITTVYKQLYDERLYIISEVLKLPVFPRYEECLIYENKRFLSFWLAANNLPYPVTNIFYDSNEAEEFISKAAYPIVAKVNIGASGSGVSILHTRKEAENYVEKTFHGKGAPKRWGPNIAKGGLLKRGFYYVKHPFEIQKKLITYNTRRLEKQNNFVFFQEYINHNFEWRVVRIGDSFFAHKKMKLGEKSSGSLKKGYENPPLSLLNFVKEITDKAGFFSQAVDIFEDSSRGYLINEMQCMFGQSDPYQMLVNGKPGRYRFYDNKWFFEEGDFAKNACFDLRLEYVFSKLNLI